MDYDYIECGDCLKLLKQLPDNSIDLVVTDPPYLFTRNDGCGAFGKAGKSYHKEYAKVSTFKTALDQRKANQRSDIGVNLASGFNEEILTELIRVMKKVNIYIWCSKNQVRWLLNYFSDYNHEILTWHKSNPIPTCNNTYLSDTEYLLFFREKGVKLYGDYNTKRKYYITPINKADKEKYGHPTIKPVDIIENLIVNSSLENDIVLDPFLGSGTTAVACVNTNRHYIGYELDPKYYNIACKRLDEAESSENTTIGGNDYEQFM